MLVWKQLQQGSFAGSRPAARLPAQPDTDPARGTSRSASPHPSQLWRSTPAVEPPPSSAGCLQSDRQIHWPTRPHANAPASLHSLQPREIPVPPTNSPAATVAPRFDPCTPVRIEPLPDVRAPKGSNPIRATTSLTQGAASAPRQTEEASRQITFALFNRSIPLPANKYTGNGVDAWKIIISCKSGHRCLSAIKGI